MMSFRMLELRILNDSTKLKRSAKYNNEKNHTHQIEMSLNSNKKDSDNLSKLQEQNREEYEDGAEEIEYTVKIKSNKTKENIQKKKKKKRLRKLIFSRALPQRDFSSSEFASSDSITGKRMSDVIFDLTLSERMNGLACWMKHTG